jgi:hypothetical protein
MASAIDHISSNEQTAQSPSTPKPPARSEKSTKSPDEQFLNNFTSTSNNNDNENTITKSQKEQKAAKELADLFNNEEDTKEQSDNPNISKTSTSNNNNNNNNGKTTSLTTPLTASNISYPNQSNGEGDVIAGSTSQLPTSDLSTASTVSTSTKLNSKAVSSMANQALFTSFSNGNSTNNNSAGINENVLTQILNGSQQQQSNYSNANYMLRRERSLDRAPVTENFIENYLLTPSASMRRSFMTGSQQNNANQTSKAFNVFGYIFKIHLTCLVMLIMNYIFSSM